MRMCELVDNASIFHHYFLYIEIVVVREECIKDELFFNSRFDFFICDSPYFRGILGTEFFARGRRLYRNSSNRNCSRKFGSNGRKSVRDRNRVFYHRQITCLIMLQFFWKY